MNVEAKLIDDLTVLSAAKLAASKAEGLGRAMDEQERLWWGNIVAAVGGALVAREEERLADKKAEGRRRVTDEQVRLMYGNIVAAVGGALVVERGGEA